MSLDMNPEVRAQWCAALRSGEYKQTDEALRRLPGDTGGHPEGYCCLGVLIDLYVKDGHSEMIPDPLSEADDPPLVSVWADPSGTLPAPVMEWAGLDSADPVLKAQGGVRASNLNDTFVTFAVIANLIDGGAS